MRGTARYALNYYRGLAPGLSLGRALLRRIAELRESHIPIAIKLGLVIAFLIVTGMGSLGIWMAGNQDRLMHEQLHDFGVTVVQQLAHIANEPILSEDSLGLTVLTTRFTQSEKVLGAAIYADTGELLASAGLQPVAGFNPVGDSREGADEPVRHWFWEDAAAGGARRVSFVTAAKHRDLTTGYAMVTLSASLMEAASHKARDTILYATLFMCLLASLAALMMSRRLSRPIHTLMEATQAVGRGDLDVRIADRRNDEIGVLIDSFNSMADGLLIKARVEQMLSRYVSKNVAERILANLDQIRLGSRHVDATVLFVDIVGFTGLAERLQPTEVSDLLNEYFSYISVVCKLYNGVIDKFIGDCAMLVFGAVEDDPEHEFHALASAVLIQKLAARLNIRRQAAGLPRVDFRIGVNSGRMLAGNLGSDERMEYTVVGDAVNLASRLASEAKSGQIIVREELFMNPGLHPRICGAPHKTIAIRGKSSPVTTYNVSDIHSSYQRSLEANLEEIIASRSKVGA